MTDIVYSETQIVHQLDARQGGYHYLEIPADFVDTLEKGKKTRLICCVNNVLEFQCGLSHLGNGNYFIILSKDNRKKAGIEKGDSVTYFIKIDPNPLGVSMPESLEILLDQDPDLTSKWEKLTDGKKRSVIHAVSKIKNIDLQVTRSIELIDKVQLPRQQRK